MFRQVARYGAQLHADPVFRADERQRLKWHPSNNAMPDRTAAIERSALKP